MSKYLMLLMLSVCLCACAQGGEDDGGGGDDGSSQADSGSNGGQCSLCDDTQACCGGFCTDISSNVNHCGGCDQACDPNTANSCGNARCECNFGPACSGGSTCCTSGCKDLDTDPNNCGVCGYSCGANGACVEGECVCGTSGEVCGAGTMCCAEGCVDLSTDAANCGACGNACGAGDACMGGVCACPHVCPVDPGIFTNIVCCESGCFDLCSDAAHCGTCDPTECSSCELGACYVEGMTDPITPPDILNCTFF